MVPIDTHWYRDSPDEVEKTRSQLQHDREMRDLMTPGCGITVDECRYGRMEKQ